MVNGRGADQSAVSGFLELVLRESGRREEEFGAPDLFESPLLPDSRPAFRSIAEYDFSTASSRFCCF